MSASYADAFEEKYFREHPLKKGASLEERTEFLKEQGDALIKQFSKEAPMVEAEREKAEQRTSIRMGKDHAAGGPVSPGNLYKVGEGNRPELFMIPGERGEVLSSDKVDKLAAAGSTGASGSGGIHINLAVHGVTKDQIMQQITNEVLRALQ
jgi:hypothetical protein